MDEFLTYSGYRVVESPLCREPKLRLSFDVDVSDAFRSEFNAWLLERFGDREVVYVIDPSTLSFLAGRADDLLREQYVRSFSQPMLVAGPLTIDALRKAAKLIS